LEHRIHSYGNCNRWISRNRIAFSKYIKQNQVPADAEINGFAKVFTINIMLMKHMTLFSLKQLTVYQDSLETVETLSFSFDSEK
jgi:hypothetical protein